LKNVFDPELGRILPWGRDAGPHFILRNPPDP